MAFVFLRDSYVPKCVRLCTCFSCFSFGSSSSECFFLICFYFILFSLDAYLFSKEEQTVCGLDDRGSGKGLGEVEGEENMIRL